VLQPRASNHYWQGGFAPGPPQDLIKPKVCSETRFLRWSCAGPSQAHGARQDPCRCGVGVPLRSRRFIRRHPHKLVNPKVQFETRLVKVLDQCLVDIGAPGHHCVHECLLYIGEDAGLRVVLQQTGSKPRFGLKPGFKGSGPVPGQHRRSRKSLCARVSCVDW